MNTAGYEDHTESTAIRKPGQMKYSTVTQGWGSRTKYVLKFKLQQRCKNGNGSQEIKIQQIFQAEEYGHLMKKKGNYT